MNCVTKRVQMAFEVYLHIDLLIASGNAKKRHGRLIAAARGKNVEANPE
jgi:hypothetical protein